MPRLGIGMPIAGGATEAAVLAVEDFVFLNDVSGELTPVDTSSRTNKILQSQTFKTTWTTNNAAIPNDLYEAPNNSLTSQAITATSAGASDVYVKQSSITIVAGETYTYSAHIKAGANGFVRLYHSDNIAVVANAYFNLSTGAVSNTQNILTSSFDKMDDGWIRVSITFQTVNASSSSQVRIFAAAAAGSTATGASFQAGTELLYIWGAQLEEDSRPTAYIVTTNAVVNVATTELGDLSNVWDFDGTDIMLEVDPENEGAFEEATANLITNHDFAADSNWSKGTGWSIANNKASNDGTGGILRQSNAVPLNTQLEVVFTVDDYVTGNLQIKFSPVSQTIDLSAGNGTYTTITNGNNTTNGDLQIIAGNSFQGSITNISVKEYAITPLNV